MTASRTAAAATPRGSVPLRIGVRLRAARLAQKLTIEAVADATGLTKGFISRLERDAASPSVASLVAVCEAIGLRVGSLFDPPEAAVVRAGTGRPISFGAVRTTESLLTPGTQAQLEVIHSLLDGGGHGGEELYSLDCEVEFVYVVGGRLELVVQVDGGAESTFLGPGDAMTFPGRTPHTWRNASAREPCEVLWVLSPTP